MVRGPHDVLATREARAQLPALLERFRQAGAGGRERVAAALEQQAREAGETLDADAAMVLVNQELHAMRRERRAKR